MDQNELEMIAREVGQEFSFEEVYADFAPFADLKARWKRSYSWIDITVTDYLENAPKDVVKNVITTIFYTIREGEGTEYSEEAREYFYSDEFCEMNQATFMSRHQFEEDRRINKLYEGLKDAEGVKIGIGPNLISPIETSSMFKVLLISNAFRKCSDAELKMLISCGTRFIKEGREQKATGKQQIRLDHIYKEYIDEFGDAELSKRFLRILEVI